MFYLGTITRLDGEGTEKKGENGTSLAYLLFSFVSSSVNTASYREERTLLRLYIIHAVCSGEYLP